MTREEPQIRVLFLPSWKENPYQGLLAEHLSLCGVRVKHGKRRLLRSPRAILKRRIDVLHLHSSSRFAEGATPLGALANGLRSIGCLLWLRLRGVRVVFTAHDLHDHERRHPAADYLFTWCLLRLASAVVSHGERAMQLLRERYKLRRSHHLVVIPHGPFTGYSRGHAERASARRQLGLSDDVFVFLFLGAIRPYKGVLELIRAFSELGTQDARLLIRGRARDPALSEALAAAAEGCAEIDLVEEFVAEDEVAGYFAACDAVVAPYTAVLTSGSVVLAMSLGRPCIAPRLGGIPDSIDESCGFLYEPDEPSALCDALRQALARRDELPSLGRAAYERATALSWEQIAERTHAMYRRTLASRAPQTAVSRAPSKS